jgi:hypothetical protein
VSTCQFHDEGVRIEGVKGVKGARGVKDARGLGVNMLGDERGVNSLLRISVIALMIACRPVLITSGSAPLIFIPLVSPIHTSMYIHIFIYVHISIYVIYAIVSNIWRYADMYTQIDICTYYSLLFPLTCFDH